MIRKERKADYVKEESPERVLMMDRLESYRRSGCILMLSGKVCYPRTIVNAYFREDRVYMPDFIADENDVIRRINYNRVR